jgi:hypothetical protein
MGQVSMSGHSSLDPSDITPVDNAHFLHHHVLSTHKTKTLAASQTFFPAPNLVQSVYYELLTQYVNSVNPKQRAAEQHADGSAIWMIKGLSETSYCTPHSEIHSVFWQSLVWGSGLRLDVFHLRQTR